MPVLPDWRNLGTILRILLAVNGGAAMVALAVAPSVDGFADLFVRMTGYVEPHLIAELAVLYAAAPVLARQPYRIGVACVYAIGVAVALLVHLALRKVLPGATDSLLKHRAELERLYAAAAERHRDDVPLPPHWGGYRLRPDAYEFWEHGDDRLHDRVRYERDAAGWSRMRLAP